MKRCTEAHLTIALVGMVAAGACLLWLSAVVPRVASAAGCPNEAIRAEQTSTELPEGSIHLPGCMALEMVSPPVKYGTFAVQPVFSASGDRVSFRSAAALAETPGLTNPFDPYVATRTASGWVTTATAPAANITSGSNGGGYPFVFSSDLSRWADLGATDAQGSVGVARIYRWGIGEPFAPISPLLNPLAGALSIPADGTIQGASGDLSQVFFTYGSPGVFSALLPGDPVPAGQGSTKNVYGAYLSPGGIPALDLLQRDSAGKAWGGSCGSEIGGLAPSQVQIHVIQGAVSPDASRIFFSTRPSQPPSGECSTTHGLRILERVETPSGPEISEPVSSECTRVAPPCESSNGDDEFQAASLEGTKLFFTTVRQLADTDTDVGSKCTLGGFRPSPLVSQGCDLYLYDSSRPPGDRLTQISAGDGTDPTPGSGAEVLGVMAVSGDGSHAYFVANGVLTTSPNPEGAVAQAGNPNLYLYERDSAHPSGRTSFIGTLDPECAHNGGVGDCGAWSPALHDAAMAVPILGPLASGPEIGGDGRVLVFRSTMPLTADDTDGNESDVFRYDSATSSLERVSKADPGGADNGSHGVLFEMGGPGVSFAQEGRLVSEDGNTISFDSEEPLASGAAAGLHSYLWHSGQLVQIPGSGATLSQSGEEVAFVTYSQLLAQDGDTARDIYVARVDGGFPNPAPPAPGCRDEACQGPAGSAPQGLPVSTDQFTGPGNRRPPHRKKHRRHHHAKKAHKHKKRGAGR